MAKQRRWGRRGTTSTEPAAVPVEVPAEEPAVEPADAPAEEPGVVLTKPVDEPAPEAPEGPAGPAAEVDGDARPAADDARPSGGRLRRAVGDSAGFALLQASHPRQAVATGVGLGLAALAAERPLREAAVVAATGLVGQTVLGWHNDIVDRARDTRHRTPRKPLADGRLEVGSVWYALVVAVLLVIPLSISTGVTAGTYYLGALAVGLLGNVALRRGRFSMLSWAAQFALYVPYLSLGGWGGSADGDPPEVAMVVAFALLGVGVHFLRSIWGLVADDADRWSYLPLALGRRLGATRLLAVSAAYTVVVLAAIVVLGGTVGLRQ